MNFSSAELQRIDLHTHSDRSDGALTPTALVERAAARKVELLAVTDHDTLAGCVPARQACEALGIGFVSGVELTCRWREREIHVVGLRVDDADPGLNHHCGTLLELRRRRIHDIGRRLSAAGLPGDALTREALNSSAPTRTHVARAICAAGIATSVQRAFDRWLKRGQAGYVATDWPDLPSVVRCLVAAGGIAVLAHPHRYQVSSGVLRQLVE